MVDKPNLGYYISDSNRTFQAQISEMQSAGITFAVVSWWGPFARGEEGAINRATNDLLRYLKGTNSSFQVAIMVDSFPGTCNPSLPTLPASQIYDYIQNAFITPFHHWYFQWEGKPLLLFFNPLQPGPNANFTVRTMGNRPNLVDWSFWDVAENFSQGEGGTGVNMSNDVGDPYVSPDGEVTIVPRIDSYFNYASGYQSGYLRSDANLTLGLYQYEWNYVLGHRSEVKLVRIFSWNEFHVRTGIEPQADSNSSLSGDYILNTSETYVRLLIPMQASSSPGFSGCKPTNTG